MIYDLWRYKSHLKLGCALQNGVELRKQILWFNISIVASWHRIQCTCSNLYCCDNKMKIKSRLQILCFFQAKKKVCALLRRIGGMPSNYAFIRQFWMQLKPIKSNSCLMINFIWMKKKITTTAATFHH